MPRLCCRDSIILRSQKCTDRTKLIYPRRLAPINNFLAVKKYVIGSPIDLAGIASQQHYPNNTYMMRLAEMYLIYVEATMGNSGSTSDRYCY